MCDHARNFIILLIVNVSHLCKWWRFSLDFRKFYLLKIPNCFFFNSIQKYKSLNNDKIMYQITNYGPCTYLQLTISQKNLNNKVSKGVNLPERTWYISCNIWYSNIENLKKKVVIAEFILSLCNCIFYLNVVNKPCLSKHFVFFFWFNCKCSITNSLMVNY